jgi:hypothetical protein
MGSTDTIEVLVTFVKVHTATLVVEVDEYQTAIPRSEVQYDGLLEHCQPGEMIEIRVSEAIAHSRGLI